MYRVGDRVVYPPHGAGVIKSIEEKTVLKEKKRYYILQLISNNMTIMLPIDKSTDMGLREIIEEKEVKKVFRILKANNIESADDWKERYNLNLEKIKSGSIFKIAEVARNLANRNKEKGLSAGEKRLLDSAYQLIASEIAYVKNINEDEALLLIDNMLRKY